MVSKIRLRISIAFLFTPNMSMHTFRHYFNRFQIYSLFYDALI